MLQINGKTFMNLQEAVQWLLDNNALPFQSSANYVANTEIGMGTIVNPSPAKVRIGSLIFFADSKVSTVIALTENGFIVSDQYNDLVDDIVYISNVAINISGHLIVSLSNGTDIDAGLIKQISGLNINASQHLIANYNDGSSEDLGAIFSGNVTISGRLDVTGNASIGGDFGCLGNMSGDFNFTAGISANKLEQRNVNWSNNFGLQNYYGLTITNVYCKLQVINGRLDIIANFKAKNETGSAITTQYFGSAVGVLNATIASKLIDLLGNDATTTPAQAIMITASHAFEITDPTANTTAGTVCEMIVYNNTASNQLLIRVNGTSSTTFGVNEERYYTARVQLDLI